MNTTKKFKLEKYLERSDKKYKDLMKWQTLDENIGLIDRGAGWKEGR